MGKKLILFMAVLLIGCGDWKGAVTHTEPKPEVKPAPVCAESCGDLTEMVEVQTIVKSKECPKGYVSMAITPNQIPDWAVGYKGWETVCVNEALAKKLFPEQKKK